MMSPLLPAFALSLVLHGIVLIARPPSPAASSPAVALSAELRPIPIPEIPIPLAEPLLKNTIDADATREPPPAAPPPPKKPEPRAPAVSRRELAAAQRKLSSHVFYPPEAVAQGLEGEVRLLLRLAADGQITRADVAAGSGHPVLDQAAVRAAYAMGRLASGAPREMILPVVFRLE